MAKLLPPPLAVNTHWEALDSANERLESIDLSPLLIYIVDIVSTDALPHLADQFHVLGNEGWAFADTVDKKRELVKRAIELHRYKGTPWAVENAIKTLGYDARVTEWFESDYGDSSKPYFFKVKVSLGGTGISSEAFYQLTALINEYKNVRSWLEDLHLTLEIHGQTPVMAGCILSGEVITIYPYMTTHIESPATFWNAGCLSSTETVTIYPYG